MRGFFIEIADKYCVLSTMTALLFVPKSIAGHGWNQVQYAKYKTRYRIECTHIVILTIKNMLLHFCRFHSCSR